MKRIGRVSRCCHFFLLSFLVLFFLIGCSGDDGEQGPMGPAGSGSADVLASTATSLHMVIDKLVINSAPVVDFTVTNQDGDTVRGLTTDDLRFAVAKLVSGSFGSPSQWQSYLNQTETATEGPATGNSAIQATRENNGQLVEQGKGRYRYTFATDITQVTMPLAVVYDASLTHRFSIQTSGALPAVNATYTFRPSDGSTEDIFRRDIVSTAKCNACHYQLEAHDARIDVKYCVICHNPGSKDANSGNVVDFKVMIHKIHRGANLPSVIAGGEYAIWGFRDNKHDYSDLELPQDIRYCNKCHDGEDPETPQGHYWNSQASMEACGSCHDNIDFNVDGSATPGGHPGGIVADNSECTTCHSAGRIAGSIEQAHNIPAQVEQAKYQFNLLNVTGGNTPVIEFSVTDPSNNQTLYDITSGAVFTTPSTSRLAILIGWNTLGFTNQLSNVNSGQPISINPVDACDGIPIVDWACTVTAGVYSLTKLSALPVDAQGTGRVGFEGHLAAQDDTDAWSIQVPVTSVVKDFSISDNLTERRQVVAIEKCNQCHQQLSLHGNNRTDQIELCVICHNARATDVNQRPKNQAGAPDASLSLDGKTEASIDFKRLIHAIHAAAKTNYDGSAAHGFRQAGLIVFGFGNRLHDFSHVRFPGSLQACEACHLPGTYELIGPWEIPSQHGILGSVTQAAPHATDATSLANGLMNPSDDLRMTPIASVCTSCHDGILARTHMTLNGAIFDANQASIDISPVETCAVCHGPGRVADVALVHAPH